MAFQSLGCTRHTVWPSVAKTVTETQNYKMLPVQGNKTSKVVKNEVRVFQTHEGKFFLQA